MVKNLPSSLFLVLLASLVTASIGVAQSFTLTVQPLGTGAGTLSGQGLTCAGTCTGTFTTGSSVTISAASASDSTFGGWSVASCGTSSTCTITVTAAQTVSAYFIYTPFLSPAPAGATWSPPIGIPRPEFGIEESYRMYDLEANRNSDLPYRQNSEGGFYTHYVDSGSGCTDTNNPYGTPGLPRCRIPIDLPAGSVVQLQGGPFTYGNYNGGGAIGINSLGTAERPVFVRSLSKDNPVVLNRGAWIRGHYIIVENLKWDLNNQYTNALSVRSATSDPIGHNHHISIRHSEAMNVSRTAGSGAVFAAYGEPGNEVHDIVYYANHIHPDDVDVLKAAPESREKDTVGISIANDSNRIWMVDNVIHGAGGDAIGAGHGDRYTARNYFIGRNDMYDNGENSVDFKEVENVVISQNKMHNMRGPSAGSDGTIAVVHYGPTYSPRNLWFLYNEIYDASSGGIQIGGTSTHESFVIGNIFYDITNINGTGRAFYLRNSQPGHLVGNVFYRNDRHMVTGQGVSGNHVVENNIFGNVINPTTGFHIDHETSNTGNNALMSNNIFHQSNGAVRIKWGGAQYVQVPNGRCPTCIYADPRFVDPANNNFRLLAGSPAINAGAASSFFARYQSLYGVSILRDFGGFSRPLGAGWEIGPYEYTAVPTAPRNLTMLP